MRELSFVEFPAFDAVVGRATTTKEAVGPTIERLFAELSGALDVVTGPPLIFYLRWEPEECEVEAALPIQDGARPAGFEVKSFARRDTVMVEHWGPYDGLAAAWADLWSQISAQGFHSEMPCWDRYVTDPGSEPDSSKWLTELYVPVTMPTV
jgi:effector-binding domain-containing protein